MRCAAGAWSLGPAGSPVRPSFTEGMKSFEWRLREGEANTVITVRDAKGIGNLGCEWLRDVVPPFSLAAVNDLLLRWE